MAQHIRHTSRWLLRRFSNLLSILLALLIHGFSGCKSSSSTDDYYVGPAYGSQPIPYGSPVEYTFEGHVALQPTRIPVEGIQVTVCEDNTGGCHSQSVASNGEFFITLQYPIFTDSWNVRAEDIDGDAHGYFAPQSTVVIIPKEEQWSTHIDVEVDLTLREVSQ